MRYLLLIYTFLGLASCVTTKHNSSNLSNSLEVNVVDRQGRTYSEYIVRVSNEKGEYIYSHVVSEGRVGNVSLNGIKPGMYKITATCRKTSIEGEKLVEYNGKIKEVKVEIPNIQYWLNGENSVVNHTKNTNKP